MRTADERITQLHKRASVLKRQRDKRRLASLGAISAFLAVLLMAAVLKTGGMSGSTIGNQLTGSSFLNDSMGGYVLTAVLAFFAGVIIATVIFRYRRNRQNGNRSDHRKERGGIK